jgi:hypothetical protein
MIIMVVMVYSVYPAPSRSAEGVFFAAVLKQLSGGEVADEVAVGGQELVVGEVF